MTETEEPRLELECRTPLGILRSSYQGSPAGPGVFRISGLLGKRCEHTEIPKQHVQWLLPAYPDPSRYTLCSQ